ncbi:MAG: hypothetical protein OSB00_09885 [Sphingomonas bacterium]|nr:hypothetical protein [Sphingomonas bacterium]
MDKIAVAIDEIVETCLFLAPSSTPFSPNRRARSIVDLTKTSSLWSS